MNITTWGVNLLSLTWCLPMGSTRHWVARLNLGIVFVIWISRFQFCFWWEQVFSSVISPQWDDFPISSFGMCRFRKTFNEERFCSITVTGTSAQSYFGCKRRVSLPHSPSRKILAFMDHTCQTWHVCMSWLGQVGQALYVLFNIQLNGLTAHWRWSEDTNCSIELEIYTVSVKAIPFLSCIDNANIQALVQLHATVSMNMKFNHGRIWSVQSCSWFRWIFLLPIWRHKPQNWSLCKSQNVNIDMSGLWLLCSLLECICTCRAWAQAAYETIQSVIPNGTFLRRESILSESANLSRSTDSNPWDQYEFSIGLGRVGDCLNEAKLSYWSNHFPT